MTALCDEQRSIEINPTHLEEEYLEIPIKDGLVEGAVTLCFRALFKHAGRKSAGGDGDFIFR